MTSEVLFKLIIELIIALSNWLYPIVILIALLLYRKPISALLDRVKKGELFGNKFELDPVVDDFQKSVQESRKEVEQLEAKNYVLQAETGEFSLTGGEANFEIIKPETINRKSEQTEIDINRILDDSQGSPELAIIRLSNLLENESIAILGSMGFLPAHPKRLSPFSSIQELEKKGLLPINTLKSIRQFFDLRNKIVHGKGQIDEKEILRVLDIGIDLLKTIRSIPHEIHIVEDIVNIFEDKECKNKRKDATGVIITSESNDGGFYRRLFHSSKIDYYEAGKRVTWEWDLSRKFDESWYIDKKDSKAKKINSSLDFIGRQLDDI